jgi:hypothetical protein
LNSEASFQKASGDVVSESSYDTLIEKSEIQEVVAVLAHKLGL